MSQFAANDKITQNYGAIFLSKVISFLKGQTNKDMRVYCEQKVGEHFCFVFFCSEMDEWWYFYTPFALLRWRRDTNMKIHHRIYIVHILIES